MGIRRLGPEDIGFAVRLTIEEGWNYTPLEMGRMLELDPEGSFVYEERRPLGFVTCVTYGRTGVVGHLIVSKEGRGKGIGGALVKAAVEYMEGAGTESMLIYATEEAAGLYRRHGFVTCDEILCIHSRLTKAQAGKHDPLCAPLKTPDLDEVFALDRELFGDDRGKLLRVLYRDCPRSSFKLERDGRIEGYILARPDHAGHNLGPWACASDRPGDAEALFRSALSTFSEGIIYMGLFARNPEAARIVRKLPEEKMWDIAMMIRGKKRYTADVRKLFGVAAMELG